MRFFTCFTGACLVAAARALPAACPAIRPVTTTLVVWVDPPSSTADSSITTSPSPSSTSPSAASITITASETASASNSSDVTTSATSAELSSASDKSTLSTVFTPMSSSSTVSQTSPETISTSTSSTASPSTTPEPASASQTASTSVTSVPSSSSTSETTGALGSSTTATSSPSPSSTSASSTTSSSSAASSTPTPATSSSPAASPSPYRAYPADIVDKLRDSSFPKLQEFSARNLAASGCTLENAAVRREWSDLSVPEREEYIAAVKCLMNRPSKLSAAEVPGAKSRYDDFLAAHIQQTPMVHSTASFLGWHRYYTWAFEQALRQECGYTGYQPYWNWDRYAADPANSPLFNGNASSLSGNSPRPGACVDTGPFAGMKVNLGPGSSLQYNPRCIKRSISKSDAAQTTADKTYALITRSNSIVSFQGTMQAVPGVHSSGHFTVGGDPGGDVYTSPGDPYFWLHHAMIDRVWWIWQMQDLGSRISSVGGNTGAWGNGGRAGTIDDLVNLGVNGGAVKLGSLLNTLGGKGGEFCYIYM